MFLQKGVIILLMKSEYGFILPLTLGLMFIISSVVLYQTERYVIEKRFYFEQAEIVTLETLLQMATVDLLNDLRKDELSDKGDYIYDKGIVTFSVLSQGERKIEFMLQAKTFQGRQRFIQLHYDKVKKEVTEWWEGSVL